MQVFLFHGEARALLFPIALDAAERLDRSGLKNHPAEQPDGPSLSPLPPQRLGCRVLTA